jgi:hypothetical protein
VPIDTNAVRGMIDADSAARDVGTTGWVWRGVLWAPLYFIGIPVVNAQSKSSRVLLHPPASETRPREYRLAYDSTYVATVRRRRRNSSFRAMAVAGIAFSVVMAAGTAGR